MSNDLVLRQAGLRQVTCIVGDCQIRLYGHVARLSAKNRIPFCRDPDGRLDHALGLDHAEGPLACSGVVSGGGLYEGYEHDRPGVSDGQTEAERVPSQDGRGDALLRRMPQYLTCLLYTGCRTEKDGIVCLTWINDSNKKWQQNSYRNIVDREIYPIYTREFLLFCIHGTKIYPNIRYNRGRYTIRVIQYV